MPRCVCTKCGGDLIVIKRTEEIAYRLGDTIHTTGQYQIVVDHFVCEKCGNIEPPCEMCKVLASDTSPYKPYTNDRR